MSDDERDEKRDEPLGDLAADVRSRTGGDSAGSGPVGSDPSGGTSAGNPAGGDDRPPREGPLADVASEVDERRRRTTGTDDPFESVKVGEIDGEKLWERLAEGDDRTVVTVPAEETDGEVSDSRDVRTIPKTTCHGCPYFGEPPELTCTHEGTDILEMPDSEHFRVADCPMVVEEEELGALDAESGDGTE